MTDEASLFGTSATVRERRIYAVGDIHGRLDQLDELLALIEADNAERETVPTRLVLLGNIVDYGPNAAAVLDLCMQLSDRMPAFSVLKGNHEALMVRALRGDLEALTLWMANGGAETLLSCGVPAAELDKPSALDLLVLARQSVSPEIVHWLDSLPLAIRSGRKLFVNGSIRPGLDLRKLSSDDLLNGTSGLSIQQALCGSVVVHARATPDRRLGLGHRLRIFSPDPNLLYALGFEGRQRWFLAAVNSGLAKDEEKSLPDDYLLQSELAIEQAIG